jgi:CubicO group peptidase (beta-lactamase class C family)
VGRTARRPVAAGLAAWLTLGGVACTDAEVERWRLHVEDGASTPAAEAAIEARIASLRADLGGTSAESLEARMAAYDVPGASVAAVRDGRVEWAEGFGTIGVASATPVTQGTLFQAASVSKPVTTAAALTLVAQGRLALDAPIDDALAS